MIKNLILNMTTWIRKSDVREYKWKLELRSTLHAQSRRLSLELDHCADSICIICRVYQRIIRMKLG